MTTTPHFSLDEGKLEDYPLTFSFAAAGWLQMYHFGVGKALQDLGLADQASIKLAGTSAGCIAAGGLASGVDMDDCREYAVECSNHCRSRVKHAFMLREYLLNGVKRYAMKKFVENPHLKDDLNERLEIYATVLPWCRGKKFGKGDFETPEDLGEAMAASCCLTPIAGFPFQLRKTGEWVCDGGITAFQPRSSDPNVITVSALYGPMRAHIKPTCFIPIWWGLYPPNEAAYREVYDIAYNDAITYLVKVGKIEKSELRRLRPVKLSSLRGSGGKVQTVGTGWLSVIKTFVWDTLVVLTFLCIIRPIAMGLIYLEIILWGAMCTGLAFFHETSHTFWWACDLLAELVWGGGKNNKRGPSVDGIPSSPRQSHNRTFNKQHHEVEGSISDSEASTSTSTRSSNAANHSKSTPQEGGLCNSAMQGPTSTSETGEKQERGGGVSPRRRGNARKKSNRKWVDVYQSARNLISIRTWVHLNFLGDKVPINNKRLEKSSRLYRVLRPMVYDRDLDTGKKEHED